MENRLKFKLTIFSKLYILKKIMIPQIILTHAEAQWGESIKLYEGIDLRRPAKEAWQGSEHDLQKKFFQYLATTIANDPSNPIIQYLWITHAIPNGGKRSKSEAAKFKLEGVKSGIPDVFVPLNSTNYNGLYIEFKKAGGSPSKNQRFFLNCLRDQKYWCVIVNDLDTAVSAFENYVK